MARRTILSPATGETFVFDDDWNEPDGRVRQIQYELQPNKPVPAHRHANTAQSFDVVTGVLHVRVNNRISVLQAGQRMSTGRGETHAQWNEGPDPVHAIETYDPPLAIEPFFTMLPRAVDSGNPFKIAILLADFGSVNAVASLPQRLFVGVFAPLGRLFGLSKWYRSLT